MRVIQMPLMRPCVNIKWSYRDDPVFTKFFNEEQIQEIVIDGAVTQVGSRSNRLSLFT